MTLFIIKLMLQIFLRTTSSELHRSFEPILSLARLEIFGDVLFNFSVSRSGVSDWLDFVSKQSLKHFIS